MSYFVLCKKLLFQGNTSRNLSTHFILLQNSYYYKSFTSLAKESFNSQLNIVSYLVDSCGLSHEAATKAAKKLQFKSTSRPDSVLKLFQDYGLTKTQITNLIIKRPTLILSNPHKTVEPKLQILKKIGFSGHELGELLLQDPFYFYISLQHRIIPSLHFLKTFLKTDENVRLAIKKCFFIHILGWNPEKSLTPKIKFLQDHGVPEPNISNLFFYGFRGFTLDNTRFKGTVKDVLGRGFDPSRTMFTYALCVLSGMSKAKKRKKFGVFRSFGWADDQIHLAFRNQPTCLDISEEKLRTGLNFFMNIKSWEAAQLAKAPNVLGLSMKKRVIPRLTVIEFLVSKSLIKKDVRIVSSLLISDAKFMEKFVAKYGDKVPELIKLYHEVLCFWSSHFAPQWHNSGL